MSTLDKQPRTTTGGYATPFIAPRVDPGRITNTPERVNQAPRLAPAPPKTPVKGSPLK